MEEIKIGLTSSLLGSDDKKIMDSPDYDDDYTSQSKDLKESDVLSVFRSSLIKD